MDFWQVVSGGFMPHGYCLRWDGPLLAVFIAANAGIAIAYFLIPLALRHFVGRRKDLPYPYMFKLFAAFILSCGITHLAKIWTLWQPAYWIEAGLDMLTAIISLATAVLFLPLIPKLLKLRGPEGLAEANLRLADANRELAESEQKMHARVRERTAELSDANDQLKLSEEQFRVLFDSMPQLGWTASPAGAIEYYNKGWYDYTGTAPGEVDGHNWHPVHHPDYVDEVAKRWQQSVDTEQPFEMQFPLKGKDGKFRWFLTRVNPLRDEDGKVVKWIGINTDIEDSRNAADLLEARVRERTAQLEAARLEAVRANEFKSQFVANISHEIRTPMSGVLGLSELLVMETEGETQETAQHINTAAQNLMSLVNDLLDLSKLEAGRMTLERVDFDVRSLVEEVQEIFSVMSSDKGLALDFEVDDRVPKAVSGDQGKLRQVLQNLVQNAIKFTEQGQVKIVVRVESREANTVYLNFAVSDTGPGISADDQKKLFQLFVQVDGSTTRNHGGTGLGLALSKRLVETMNGSISLDSVVGQGSVFSFTVPLEADE